jgi:hypothetical protein
MSNIQSGFIVDGKFFATKQEAQDFIRLPKIKEAFKAIKGANEELVNWLVEKEDEILAALDAGKSRRVLKTERNKLQKAMDHVVETMKEDKKAAFVIEQANQLVECFKWPAVKRLKDDEALAAAQAALTALADGNADVAKWVMTNGEAIKTGYEAGIEKREVTQDTLNRLAEARAKLQAAKKAREEAEKKAA